jgi:hypothetical protein
MLSGAAINALPKTLKEPPHTPSYFRHYEIRKVPVITVTPPALRFAARRCCPPWKHLEASRAVSRSSLRRWY